MTEVYVGPDSRLCFRRNGSEVGLVYHTRTDNGLTWVFATPSSEGQYLVQQEFLSFWGALGFAMDFFSSLDQKKVGVVS